MNQGEAQGVRLNRFLAEVEQSAFHIARYAVRDSEEALDIVQDAMLTLASRYGGKPADQWRPLFFRILQNRIRDWHRRGSLRRRFLGDALHNGVDQIELATNGAASNPQELAGLDAATRQMQSTVERLPLRQQQAFLLRTIEGMSVAETAKAMGCTQGSVKTHYSRAVHTLRDALEDHWQ